MGSPERDPLAGQLRRCMEMGEHALSSRDCRAAWAEKRRRFFGVDHPNAYSGLGAPTSPRVEVLPRPLSGGEQGRED